MNIIAGNEEVISALSRVDWDFPRSATPPETVHSLHWFPGNFIPQIPAFLIQALSRRGAIVCDPFCGSGTTGVEALRLGRHCWQSDVNRASVQVAAGKLAALSAQQHVQRLKDILNSLVLDLKAFPRSHENGCGSSPELDRWLHPETHAQLRFIWGLATSGGPAQSILELIFTDTLFACASVAGARTSTGRIRRHHWGWVADNVRPKTPVQHDAFEYFRNRLFRAIQILTSQNLSSEAKATVRREDARHISLPDESADLVVTSPPYLGMIDYTAANRLTYLWMGWPLNADMELEIGARRYRDRPKALENYLSAMDLAARHVARILKPEGYCAIVIGASRKYPDAADAVISILSNQLDVVWGPVTRTPSRRRVSLKGASAPSELICVFRK